MEAGFGFKVWVWVGVWVWLQAYKVYGGGFRFKGLGFKVQARFWNARAVLALAALPLLHELLVLQGLQMLAQVVPHNIAAALTGYLSAPVRLPLLRYLLPITPLVITVLFEDIFIVALAVRLRSLGDLIPVLLDVTPACLLTPLVARFRLQPLFLHLHVAVVFGRTLVSW